MPVRRTAPLDQPQSSRPVASDAVIRVRGAREHNLQNVGVDVPRDALVVFSGVSGSGKSSLAFGTIFAEAQHRFLESVAPYARRLFDQVGVPDVDSIDGLPPAVALQQQRGAPSVRSSVGSVSTISNLLRMLYSRAGTYPPGQAMLFAEDFSANTPQGACPTCHGLGTLYDVTEASMVPDDSLTIRERAVAAWPTAWQGQNLRDILVTLGHDVDTPWRDLPKRLRKWILFTDEQPTVPVYAGFSPAETRAALRRKLEPSYMGTFEGARKYVLRTFATTQSALMKKRVAQFMLGTQCPTCDGRRLTRAALSVKFAGMDIGTLSQRTLTELADVLRPAAHGISSAPEHVVDAPRRNAAARRKAGGAHAASDDVHRPASNSAEKVIAAQRIARDVLTRVETLTSLGLGYLSLERSTTTLSAGELQRVRLATQIRSNLFGVVYVLDEPSAGLHPADNESLFASLDELRQAGNSVLVVEHDLEILRRADWLVDVGPDGGTGGGRVLYSGPPAGLQSVADSRTAPYLFAAKATSVRPRRALDEWLVLRDVTRNSLRRLDVRFPLNALTMVTGISGSGKSSLVSQGLVDIVGRRLGHTDRLSPEDGDGDDPETGIDAGTQGSIVSGGDRVRRLVTVDQKPIGRTPRSNLATYTGLFDHVRRLFASTKAARAKRYTAGRFSFNVAEGRCPACEGEGFVSVELLFMATVYAPCPTCHGSRYNPATLAVRWNDRTIADVLQMTVDDAHAFFVAEPAIARPLELLRRIGLGYLRLGQPATELSGGEAQRIKLATELQRAQKRETLYILDEPSTGLHPSDVDRLMLQLHELVDAGSTVVVVEHDMRIVATADWVIDMGPGAGADGGRIVAEGRPESIAGAVGSRTSAYLAAWL